MEMTPRQRWLALFEGKEPDRVPTDYWATPELHARVLKDTGSTTEEELWRKLHIDRPRFFGPRWKHKHHPDDPRGDLWGLRYQIVDYGTGHYPESCYWPLAKCESAQDVHRFRWPSADDFDYQPVTDAVTADDSHRIRHGASFEPFLIYCGMRGMERAYEDMLVSPEILEAGLAHIFEFYDEYNRRIFTAGKGRIDVTYVAEDLGGQTGPLFSLEMYRRYLLPNQKRMADLARSFGVHIMFHTDGAARIFLPDLLEVVGIEILNPIQWRCPGMERETLARDFGRRVIFHGAIDNQHTLPFGTVDEVVAEVKETRDIFRAGRWICAPCHNIQAVTPTANVLAMYQTIHEIGKPRPAVRGAKVPR